MYCMFYIYTHIHYIRIHVYAFYWDSLYMNKHHATPSELLRPKLGTTDDCVDNRRTRAVSVPEL